MIKKGKSYIHIIFLSVFFLLFIVAFIIAKQPEVFTSIYGNQQFNNIVLEDISYVYNVTINNTWGGLDQYNITHINITLPSNIVLNLANSNYSDAVNSIFKNISNDVFWYNNTGTAGGFLINGSNSTKWFAFNATVVTPGKYNITVLVYSSNGTNLTQNIAVNVNDTTNPNVTHTNLVSQRNYTGNSLLANVSILDNFLNGLGIEIGGYAYLNITNVSGRQTVAIYNVSNVSGDNFNATIDTTVYVDGLYNITVLSNDSYNNPNNSEYKMVRFDNTRPSEINNTNTTGIFNRINHSGVIMFNLTVIDATSAGGAIWMNVTNQSGSIITSTINGTQLTTFYWNVTINTSDFADGIYNLSMTANDTAGNTNTSAIFLHTITFDNTKPREINVTSGQVNRGNYSSTQLLNFSVLDTTAGINQVFFNITNGSEQYNATINATRLSSFYWNGTINTTQYLDGIYNITAWANDSANNLNNTRVIQNVRFDNTRPREINTTSEHITRGNYSGVIELNFSLIDTTSSGGGLSINITNSSNDVVASVINASNPSSYYWNTTFNTSTLSDGIYNLTVYANDTAGNINVSVAFLHTIRIDNTKPTATFSCSPTPVLSGGTVTCSCSPSDGGSGVNSSATSYTTNPSTQNTGTHQVSCSFGDLAGNTNSVSTTYTVEQSGGGSSGGGGGSSSTTSTTYTKTFTKSDTELQAQGSITQQLSKKEKVEIKFQNEIHYVGVKEIGSDYATIEIASTPVTTRLMVGEDTKVNLNGDNYYDVYVKLNSVSNNKAEVTIQYINEIISLPVVEDSVKKPIENTPPVQKEEIPSAKGNYSVWWIIGILIVVVVVILYLFILYLKKNNVKGSRRF